MCVITKEGTTTTPFDMVVLNNLDRYQLALDAITRVPRLQDGVAEATARYWGTMACHDRYIGEHGDDMPEVKDWRWHHDTPTTARPGKRDAPRNTSKPREIRHD
jgi:phosphoketolase